LIPILKSRRQLSMTWLLPALACAVWACGGQVEEPLPVVESGAVSRDATAPPSEGASDSRVGASVPDAGTNETGSPLRDVAEVPGLGCVPNPCQADQLCLSILNSSGEEVGARCEPIPNACEPTPTCSCLESVECADMPTCAVHEGRFILTCPTSPHLPPP
jgi:hypothetical protein